VVICLERGADLHMAQLMPLPLTVSCFSKIQIGFTFWYQLTQVMLDKGTLNGGECVSIYIQYEIISFIFITLIHTSKKRGSGDTKKVNCSRF